LTRVQYKSDLLRYLYMYKFGGYYVDIDTLPLLPLDTIYEKTENCKSFFFQGAHTNPSNGVFEMHNGFMGCVKEDSLFLDLVEQMVSEPNPADYGKNVKNLYAALSSRAGSAIELYTNRAGFYVFNEVGRDGKYYMVYKDEVLAIGNGHGYPLSLRLHFVASKSELPRRTIEDMV